MHKPESVLEDEVLKIIRHSDNPNKNTALVLSNKKNECFIFFFPLRQTTE